ncbi:DUF1295 domain-containing protein [Flavobacteriaceae bacterium]|jgi:steroid 5-alpha reductase family enzyme|nr:DUF1295 domain-containing protein [Flavobacteriaceae bacterium]MDA9668854.1 DUF1295 domain-containing protein [Flavobacteriaceae bacterium]
MKESLRYILISFIVFSITYSLSLLTQIELITYAVIISFLLQWTLFIPAYFFQTEKFYDISGSINYISIVIYIYYNNYITHGFNLGNLILSFLIFLWATRLGIFLFLRIQNDGEDKRFRSIKPSPAKFFMTWTLQATWVSICSLCALTGISSDSGIIINNLFFIGLTFFVIGFFIEVVADSQKTKFRKNPKNKNTFINSGLWAYSRHPNYLGEIFIWIGISVISFSSLFNLQFATLISPIFTYVLLVYVSGVRLLEASGKEKWGHLKSYKEYIKKTPRLLFK